MFSNQKLEPKNRKQVAVKIPLKIIHQGEYIIEKEQEPNYLKLGEEFKIYRVNVIAVIINKEKIGMITNLLLDDGTDKITARIFEESKAIRTGEVGDVVQAIGRVRLYNEEKYISPEIIKKIEPLWLKTRNEELKKADWVFLEQKEINKAENQISVKLNSNQEIVSQELKAKPMEEQVTEDVELPYEKLVKLIKELDKGPGVFIEEIIEKSPLDDTEQIIQRLLEKGDIFQNQPGRVKVL